MNSGGAVMVRLVVGIVVGILSARRALARVRELEATHGRRVGSLSAEGWAWCCGLSVLIGWACLRRAQRRLEREAPVLAAPWEPPAGDAQLPAAAGPSEVASGPMEPLGPTAVQGFTPPETRARNPIDVLPDGATGRP